MTSPRATKYAERYAQGVIIRDNDLATYNRFLHNLGENQTLLEIVRGILQRKRTCRILDIGCGNANALHELKQHAGAGVHTMGVDLLPLDHPAHVDEFIQGDVHAVPLPASCDLILSFRALHEMGDLAMLIPIISRALAPGGRAYLWIRVRDLVEGRIEFIGEMNAHEEASILHFAAQSDVNGCNILVEPVRQTLFQEEGAQTAVTGYVILLFRPTFFSEKG